MREMVVTPPEVIAATAAKELVVEPTSFTVNYEAGTQFIGPKKIVAENFKLSDNCSTVTFFDKGKNVVALFNFQNVVSIELNPKG